MSTLGIQVERTSSLAHCEEFMSDSSSNTITSDDFSYLFSGLERSESINLKYEYDQHSEETAECCSSETEEEDVLPTYECTLTKKGMVYIKHEIDATGVYSTDRKWNQVLLSVEGTKVIADYGSNSKRRPSLLASLGLDFSQTDSTKNTKNLPSYTQDIAMEGAALLPAEEYAYSKPYTFRVVLASGKQFLIRSDSAEAAVDWVETLRSVIGISSDLDLRREPQFSIQGIIYEPRHYF